MSRLPTRTLLRFHRYAGLVVGPLVVFFAVSGAWQVFRLHEGRKTEATKPPRALVVASEAHKVERLGPGAAALAYKIAAATAAGLLALTTLLGIVVALRITRPRWLPILLLTLGVAVPLLLYLLALSARTSAAAGPPG